MYRFFYRFREMFLRPKLSILYSMYPIGIIYIYIIYTRVFAHICTTWRGRHSNCWNAGKKQFQGGSALTDEMLVKSHFKGEAFQLLKCLCKKQLEGGSIQTAERLVKKKQFQGGSILIAEMLVEKQTPMEKHSNCWKAGKNNFKGEAF